MLADNGCPTLEQLALAQLSTAAYDRHLRQARRRYRVRRDALMDAVARHLPDARVVGMAAGLHAIVRLGMRSTARGRRGSPHARWASTRLATT